MEKTHSIVLFNQKQIRRSYDTEKEIWYFSIIDVIEILTDTTIPRRYWSDLKGKLKNEGSEVYEKIVQLKMLAEASTTEISKKKKPKGIENNKQVAREGGFAAKKARLEIEKQTGESVITTKNAKTLETRQRLYLPDKNSK